jgi:2-methylisocitrate lyase-like PEP mutase family enzyme
MQRCGFLRTQSARKDDLPIAATGDARHFINAEIERDRFCSDAGATAVFLVSIKIRNLYTRSTQREQIRDLNIATDTKPAQLRLSQWGR